MVRLGILCVCLTAALLQVHLLQMACGNFGNDFNANMSAAWTGQGNWFGGTNWGGYRSRLLGVGLIRLFGGDVPAFMHVTVGALTVAGLLAWRLGGAGGLGILHACFAVWASPWFAPWDMLEPAVFLAFAVLVVEGWDWYWFVALFGVAIFNLQSAMFIALWMCLNGMMGDPC